MKKTLITLMALAGMASAETELISINPLTSSSYWGTWSHANNNTITNGVLSGSPNWQVDPSVFTLKGPVTFTNEQSFDFSFDITNNGTGNSMLTLAFIGSSHAVVVGHGTYASPADQIQVAVTDNITAQGYGFATTHPTDDAQLTAGATLDGGLPTGGATTTLSGNISWDTDSWVLTLNSSAVAGQALTLDTGLTSFDLKKIMVTIEGGSSPTDGRNDWKTATLSNMSVVIPEPATATLSLLALAGLAARRRRK